MIPISSAPVSIEGQGGKGPFSLPSRLTLYGEESRTHREVGTCIPAGLVERKGLSCCALENGPHICCPNGGTEPASVASYADCQTLGKMP